MIMRRILILTTIMVLFFSCKSEQPPPYPQQQVQPVPVQQPAPAQQMPPVPAPAAPVPGQQPAAPSGQPQNPLAGLAALGQMIGQATGQQPGKPGKPGQVTAKIIPWQSLSQALPTAAPGWSLQGQVEGESVNAMGINMAQASCKLKAGGMQAEVTIMDNPVTAMAGMAFAMTPTVDSSTQRMSKTNINGNPGIQTYKKQKRSAEIQVFVSNRLLVTITVKNTDNEAYAIQLAQQINYAHLKSLIGG